MRGKNGNGAESDSPSLSFVFEGCSWGCCYYLGVYGAMKEQYSPAELAGARFGGSSSGTLAALGAVLGKSVEECLEVYEELAHCGEVFGVFGLMSVYHEIVLRRWLPKGGDQHLLVQNRLFVNVTRFFCRSEVISEFNNNQEIIDALHASMHIPFYMSYCKDVRGSMGLDGGLSANIFRIDENTITVSSASRKGDVHPAVLVSATECFAPPSKQRREEIFLDGTRVKFPATTDKDKDEDEDEDEDEGEDTCRKETNNCLNRANKEKKKKAPSSWVKKMTTGLLRYTLCSVFWTCRVLEIRPWTYLTITTGITLGVSASILYPEKLSAWSIRSRLY